MKKHTSRTLDALVTAECMRQRNLWFDKYIHVGTYPLAVVENGYIQIPKQYQDEFSAMAAGCQDLHSKIEHIGCSGCNTTTWNKELKNAFKLRLGGNVGDRSPITRCKNKIGNCAEQHGANFVFNEIEHHGGKGDVDNMAFTKAIRPRTMTVHDYCSNCQTLFA